MIMEAQMKRPHSLVFAVIGICFPAECGGQAWPGILDRLRRMQRSTKRLACAAAFLGLAVIPTQLAYAIFPWPVSSASFETGAYIVWRTDVAGTSQVNYGLTSSYGSSTTVSSSLVTYHAQTITGLTAGTTYHFQVVSVDGSGNSVSSKDYTLTTLPAPTGTVLTVGSGMTYSTISSCVAAAGAGKTCEVYAKSGGYDEKVSVSVSGNSGSPLVIEAHDPVEVAAFSFGSGVSYVTVEGFEVSTSAFSDFESCSGVNAVTTNLNSYLVIANNYVHNVYDGAFMREGTFPNKSNYLQVLGNVMAFTVITNTSPPYTYPCATTNAGFAGLQEYGDHSLYDGNYFTEADHISYNAGAYDIYRRNVMSDTNASDWGASPASDHVDFFHPADQTASGGSHTNHNILEANQEYRTDTSDEHFYLAVGCYDQGAQSAGTGDGSTTTFSGTLSLTNADGTDTGIAVFSVSIVVNVTNNGCSGTQYGNATAAAVDDGFGHLVNYPGGSGVSSGTINYSTGAFSVTFSSAPASGVPITAYYALLSLSSHDMIVRYNTAYYVGACFSAGSPGGTSGMREYNNTNYHVGYNGASSETSGSIVDEFIGMSDGNIHWADLNNLFYDAWDYTSNPPWGAVGPFSPPAVAPGYGLAYDSSCAPSCSYTSSTTSAPGMVLNQDPLFNNVSAGDFTLQNASPALNAGTHLTTVASTDSGSGTSLIVNDAGFFQDGYGISGVNADCISVTTVSNHVCITAVNYQTNTLTLASSITRSKGDPVWLYSDSTGRQVLAGNAPNIGATFGAAGPAPAPATGLTADPH
jgi:hypothetical protein